MAGLQETLNTTTVAYNEAAARLISLEEQAAARPDDKVNEVLKLTKIKVIMI